MRSRRGIVPALVVTLVVSLFSAIPASAAGRGAQPSAAAAPTSVTRLIARAGTTRPTARAMSSAAAPSPRSRELRPSSRPLESGTSATGPADAAGSAALSGNNANLTRSWQGLNFHDQRYANNGNQWSLEPPDQALCVGNGWVVEGVNSVMRVYTTAGAAAGPVVDLNTFFAYPAAINRTTGAIGPDVIDPICLYDASTQRFFFVLFTLEVVPSTGANTGRSTIDIAVSRTSDPRGDWNIYRVPGQNDGTQGTPNHRCNPGTSTGAGVTNPRACFPDYPHIGADAYGLYISTNEYDFFGPAFQSANIYAFSKAQLASGASWVRMVHMNTPRMVSGNPGFTVWPAISPDSQWSAEANGTEYFLSSNAAPEANGNGSSQTIVAWAVTNTRSLTTGSPALRLSNTQLAVKRYSIPPLVDQKPGPTPLRECLNDTKMVTPFGKGCWTYFFDSTGEPKHNEKLSHPDSLDSRMQQTAYAGGLLYGALGTAVAVSGQREAGIAYYVVKPWIANGVIRASVKTDARLALANSDLTMPTVAVTSSGRGVLGFTIFGHSWYPSAGYATVNAWGVGDVHVAAAGVGPDDGFTGYKAFVGNPPRTRWGDYGAAQAVGDSVFIANEYIAQSCTLKAWVASGFKCGDTRGALANWSTRISVVKP